jgi:hypothetical protein
VKIVDKDNFCGDYPDESFVAENITDSNLASVMCEALNARYSGDHAPRYYQVVPDNYVLVCTGFKL